MGVGGGEEVDLGFELQIAFAEWQRIWGPIHCGCNFLPRIKEPTCRFAEVRIWRSSLEPRAACLGDYTKQTALLSNRCSFVYKAPALTVHELRFCR